MPYLDHFGLTEHPFTLTPNTAYFFPTRDHLNILASLRFALQREVGIIKVVGEIGTGKTLLCRLLLTELMEQGDTVAYVSALPGKVEAVVRTVIEEFGLDPDASPNPLSTLGTLLFEQHARGRRVVIVVDEAQALGREGLEAVRLLSNLESDRAKLLQIVLFGQTELDDLLSDPSLRQLRQRIVFSFATKPLTERESTEYLAHRLNKARRVGGDYEILAPSALRLIVRRCQGAPRLLNIVADKALLAAFADGAQVVQRRHAAKAIADSRELMPAKPVPRRRVAMLAACLAASLAALAVLPKDVDRENLSVLWRQLVAPVAAAVGNQS